MRATMCSRAGGAAQAPARTLQRHRLTGQQQNSQTRKQLCCTCTGGGWTLADEVVSASIYRRPMRLHLPSVPTTYFQGQRVQVVEEHARQLAPQVAVQETHLLVAAFRG